ncbi:MAG TPA: hypothetical protein VG245_03605 [Candidatus Dormibacteraeota bacterium]|jgi:hypothetical protein|nr:hypothetical protein [Candidatus Dormibacteraeota bacterium]
MKADGATPETPAPSTAIAAAVRAEAAAMNRPRWRPGQRGRYEGWYVAFNDPAGERGWWLRYSLRAPSDGAEPVCQLWFMRTDRAATPRNRALRATLPISALRAGGVRADGDGPGAEGAELPNGPGADGAELPDGPGTGRGAGEPGQSDPPGFRLRIGGGDTAASGWLSLSGCAGRLADETGEVAWDLGFEPLLPPIAPTPEWGARFATCYLEPHPLLRITGTVREGSAEHTIAGLMGEQAHVFGVRHSRRWHWAEGKNIGGGAFVGVSSWLPAGLTVTSLFLARPGAEPLLRNRMPAMLRPRTAHDPAGWRFTAESGAARLVGAVTPRIEDLIGVTYHDPSGRPVYCYHSELADLRLELQRRAGSGWRTEEVVESPGGSAFEYGGSVPLGGVPLLLD